MHEPGKGSALRYRDDYCLFSAHAGPMIHANSDCSVGVGMGELSG